MSASYLAPTAARARYEALLAYEARGEVLDSSVWRAIARRLRAAAAPLDGGRRLALVDRAADAEQHAARLAAREAAVVDELRRVLGMPTLR